MTGVIAVSDDQMVLAEEFSEHEPVPGAELRDICSPARVSSIYPSTERDVAAPQSGRLSPSGTSGSAGIASTSVMRSAAVPESRMPAESHSSGLTD